MDIRRLSEDYTEIAKNLIDTEECLAYIKESNATILYLASEHEKKSRNRVIYGECEKIPTKYKWTVPADFTITIFDPNVESFTDEQLRILMLHELLHVGIEVDGNEESYFIVPHDYEEFAEIARRYGLDWSQ